MNKIKKFFDDNKNILLVLFFVSLVTYGYLGLNQIINIDNIQELEIDKSIHYCDFIGYLRSARWGWGIITFIFGNYPAPLFFLVFNSILFSISGCLLSKIFNLKSNISKIIVGTLLIAFPYNINLYSYISHQYSIGISYFCVIYGIYKIRDFKKIKDLILPLCLFTFSISVYQTYLCYIAVLMVFISIIELIEIKSFKEYIKKIGIYLLVCILSVILYYIVLKILLFSFHESLTAYQGINNIMTINVKNIFLNFFNTFKGIFIIKYSNYFTVFLQIIMKAVVFIGLVFNFTRIKKNYYGIYILLIFVLLMSPIILQFVKTETFYHVLTYASYSVYYSGGVGLLLYCLEHSNVLKVFKNILGLILIIVCITFILKDNQVAYMSDLLNTYSFSYLNRLQTKIESLDEYSKDFRTKKVAFIGHYEAFISPSDNIYYNDVGTLSSFILTHEKILYGLNTLGNNYVLFDRYNDEKIYNEIKIDASSHKSFPHNDSVYLYEDIIVVKLNDVW